MASEWRVDFPSNKLDTHLVVERERQQVTMSTKSSVKRWWAERGPGSYPRYHACGHPDWRREILGRPAG
jgi:hypothetical protein